jgi:hypothetical protein
LHPGGKFITISLYLYRKTSIRSSSGASLIKESWR